MDESGRGGNDGGFMTLGGREAWEEDDENDEDEEDGEEDDVGDGLQLASVGDGCGEGLSVGESDEGGDDRASELVSVTGAEDDPRSISLSPTVSITAICDVSCCWSCASIFVGGAVPIRVVSGVEAATTTTLLPLAIVECGRRICVLRERFCPAAAADEGRCWLELAGEGTETLFNTAGRGG